MTISDSLDKVLSRLENVKPKSTGGFTARCPAHDDQHPSLSVDVGDEGQALICCHVGCTVDAIVSAVNLTLADLYPVRAQTAMSNGHVRTLARTTRYEIRDAAGALRAVHVRKEYSDGTKEMPWERPDGTFGLGGVKVADLPLYGVHELDGASTVILTEGEKARDALSSLGVPSVGTVTGAKETPSDASLRPLIGSLVGLWPDNDAPGRAHMDRIAERLRRLGQPAEKIRCIDWSKAPEKGDAADWLAAGGTPRDRLLQVDDALVWSSTVGDDQEAPNLDHSLRPRLIVQSLADVTPQSVDWLWPRWLARGKFHLLGGHAGDGKSTLTAALAATGSRQGTWPDGSRAPRIRTLFVLGEDSAEDTLRPRLDLHDADTSQIFVLNAVLDEEGRERFFNIARHLELLETTVIEYQIDLIVIDPLTTIMAGTDRNAEGDTRDALTPLVKLAERRGIAILGIAHVGKPSGTARRAAQKILGATAFHAMARVVWMVAPDEDEQMVLGVVKANLAMKPASLNWSRDEDGPIVWSGVSAKGVEELLTSPTPASRRANAEGFLWEYLARGAKPTVEVFQAAKERGIAEATLRRAGGAIGIKKWKHPGKDGPWYWMLPDGEPRRLTPLPHDDEGKMLTSRDADVSKLVKFPAEKMIKAAHAERLLQTTPNLGNGSHHLRESEMEDAQLAHSDFSGDEQVPWEVSDAENNSAEPRPGTDTQVELF